jgi:hypothetical protein
MIPVSKETLGTKRLKPLHDYNFVSNLAHCEILGSEFSQIALNFPIFFVDRGGVMVPVALMALEAGKSLFVDRQGRWTGLYLPTVFRRYPFNVSRGPDGAQPPQLLVDEEMISDSEGEPLFGATEQQDLDGTSLVGRVLRFAIEAEQQGSLTRVLTASISAAGIIEPAGKAMGLPDQQSFLPGFNAVNEQKLRELPDATFLELRRSGALALIYVHLVSLGQLARLQQLHMERQNAEKTTPVN